VDDGANFDASISSVSQEKVLVCLFRGDLAF